MMRRKTFYLAALAAAGGAYFLFRSRPSQISLSDQEQVRAAFRAVPADQRYKFDDTIPPPPPPPSGEDPGFDIWANWNAMWES